MMHEPLREVRAALAFLGALGPFLRERLSPAEAHGRLERQLAERERTFARVLQHAVFEQRRSPYRRLLEWAGVTLADFSASLNDVGLEATLERLHDAGVYVSLEEFKGIRPIHRPGLEIPVRADNFANPLSARQYEAQTGGSAGAARSIQLGLDLLAHESAYHALFYSAHHCDEKTLALWLPAPPGAVGIKNALIRARLGQPVARWFSQNWPQGSPLKYRAFAKATTLMAKWSGSSIPGPEYTPASDVSRVAEWLAQQRASGHPAMLGTTPSSAVRVCAAAAERGYDIVDSFFVLVGEPYTAAKAGAIAAAGCRAATHYAMVEAGMIGLACLNPGAPDDVHLVSDKIAVIEREVALRGNGHCVPALFHTTLLPCAPRLMLNVESGDYAVRSERTCGCGVLPPAFTTHLHGIRSYEKLTSDGMHFLGSDLLCLIEELLPARFGGHPTDYQLVERERDGLPKVSLIVSPSVGALDSEMVVQTMLDFLRRRGIGQRLMAEIWDSGSTLNVERREPYVTGAAKIQPLQKWSE